MTRTLVLCADDFAQSLPISKAILHLLASGRLSAVSVMSNAPLWPHLAAELAHIGEQSDIGLHFNLTQGFDGAPAPHTVSGLLLASQCRLLRAADLHQRCLDQIDQFGMRFGRLPDFVDGHQHVHALPQVRRAMFDAIAQRWPVGQSPYLRAPDLLRSRGDSQMKYLVLRWFCGGFSDQAEKRGLVTPPWFGGMYSFGRQADYGALMECWLEQAPSQGLIMCHPGQPDALEEDPIGTARAREYDYLRSAAFVELLERRGVVLGRFARAN